MTLSPVILTWLSFLTLCDLTPPVTWPLLKNGRQWRTLRLSLFADFRSGFLLQVHSRLNTDISEQQNRTIHAQPTACFEVWLLVPVTKHKYIHIYDIHIYYILYIVAYIDIFIYIYKFPRDETACPFLLSMFPFLLPLDHKIYDRMCGVLVACVMSDVLYVMPLLYVSICKKKKEKKKEKLKVGWKKISVSNNEHVSLFAWGLHTQFSQEARVDHDLAFDISCLQASRD